MKRYLWVGLLLLSNSVYALFEDEGARKKLSGEDANNDNSQSSQLVHQLVTELEDVLSVLKKD